MNRTSKIVLFYSGVAVIALAILSLAFWLRNQSPSKKNPVALMTDSGRETAPTWFPIEKDLQATNQDNQPVKLSDLRGKVWIATEFFAICPHCAVRNGSELREIYTEFKDNPDFQIACISVDPDTDKPQQLTDYAKALSADSKNWWFLNGGDTKATHQYLEKELKFFGIRERSEPLDIEANGRYQHDMGILLVDRNFNVIGKWPLFDARSEDAKERDPGLYDRLKKELYARIRAELSKNETSGI